MYFNKLFIFLWTRWQKKKGELAVSKINVFFLKKKFTKHQLYVIYYRHWEKIDAQKRYSLNIWGPVA